MPSDTRASTKPPQTILYTDHICLLLLCFFIPFLVIPLVAGRRRWPLTALAFLLWLPFPPFAWVVALVVLHHRVCCPVSLGSLARLCIAKRHSFHTGLFFPPANCSSCSSASVIPFIPSLEPILTIIQSDSWILRPQWYPTNRKVARERARAEHIPYKVAFEQVTAELDAQRAAEEFRNSNKQVTAASIAARTDHASYDGRRAQHSRRHQHPAVHVQSAPHQHSTTHQQSREHHNAPAVVSDQQNSESVRSAQANVGSAGASSQQASGNQSGGQGGATTTFTAVPVPVPRPLQQAAGNQAGAQAGGTTTVTAVPVPVPPQGSAPVPVSTPKGLRESFTYRLQTPSW